MKITVLSRPAAAAYIPSGRAAMISITNPGDAPVEFDGSYVTICRESFDESFELGNSPTQISWAQAERIAAFMFELQTDIDELVIHCIQGQSRSVGIAAAACELFEMSDAFCHTDGRRPNQLVQIRVGRQLHRMEFDALNRNDPARS